jgi:hypothetical protein
MAFVINWVQFPFYLIFNIFITGNILKISWLPIFSSPYKILAIESEIQGAAS